MEKNLNLTAYNFADISAPTENIYKSTVAIGLRAKQIIDKREEALQVELLEFNISMDDIDETVTSVDKDIREVIGRKYEMLKKPVIAAAKELIEGELMVWEKPNS